MTIAAPFDGGFHKTPVWRTECKERWLAGKLHLAHGQCLFVFRIWTGLNCDLWEIQISFVFAFGSFLVLSLTGPREGTYALTKSMSGSSFPTTISIRFFSFYNLDLKSTFTCASITICCAWGGTGKIFLCLPLLLPNSLNFVQWIPLVRFFLQKYGKLRESGRLTKRSSFVCLPLCFFELDCIICEFELNFIICKFDFKKSDWPKHVVR